MKWSETTRQIADSARMFWKWALSYRKKEWELRDYPIRVRVQKDVPEQSRYWARVLGWNIDGLGSSRAKALEELKRYFELRKAARQSECKPVPRPGTDVPVEFAAQDRVNSHLDLAEDFIHRVLDLPWAFISDESSLRDFHTETSNAALFDRITEVYGVDVSDIESGNIAEILDRIASKQKI